MNNKKFKKKEPQTFNYINLKPSMIGGIMKT